MPGVDGVPPEGIAVESGARVGDERVVGERGISSLHRARPLQSRITNLLALGLLSTLGVGLLGWYYAHTFAAESDAQRRGQSALARQASGTVPLPPLGPIRPPAITSSARPALIVSALGPAPPPPMGVADRTSLSGYPSGGSPYDVPVTVAAAMPSARAIALVRELSGPAFDTSPTNASAGPAGSGTHSAVSAGNPGTGGVASPTDLSEMNSPIGGTNAPNSRLGALLRATVTRAVRPSVLPTRRLLLPKGAFIDCTLETAIDSTLPGMTTCITATDTFGADGTVVLLPRGTELVGETRGEVQQGSARIFVLWTQARTPGGIVIPLDSPGTDALGRSGLTGVVNRHFWERFGAAILISVINGGIQYGVESQSQGGALVYEPDTSEGVMTEALKSTVDIPPTVTVANGARIQVLVARNIDFRSVYALKSTRE